MISAARLAWSRFVRISKPYFTSDSRWQALGLLAALLSLLLTISGLNIAISYVGRDFMTAITVRQSHRVYVFALIYLERGQGKGTRKGMGNGWEMGP